MLIKITAITILYSFLIANCFAQGCSDAGFCTIGNSYTNEHGSVKNTIYKNEVDVVYIYGTHGKSERFYQP